MFLQVPEQTGNARSCVVKSNHRAFGHRSVQVGLAYIDADYKPSFSFRPPCGIMPEVLHTCRCGSVTHVSVRSDQGDGRGVKLDNGAGPGLSPSSPNVVRRAPLARPIDWPIRYHRSCGNRPQVA